MKKLLIKKMSYNKWKVYELEGYLKKIVAIWVFNGDSNIKKS